MARDVFRRDESGSALSTSLKIRIFVTSRRAARVSARKFAGISKSLTERRERGVAVYSACVRYFCRRASRGDGKYGKRAHTPSHMRMRNFTEIMRGNIYVPADFTRKNISTCIYEHFFFLSYYTRGPESFEILHSNFKVCSQSFTIFPLHTHTHTNSFLAEYLSGHNDVMKFVETVRRANEKWPSNSSVNAFTLPFFLSGQAVTESYGPRRTPRLILANTGGHQGRRERLSILFVVRETDINDIDGHKGCAYTLAICLT